MTAERGAVPCFRCGKATRVLVRAGDPTAFHCFACALGYAIDHAGYCARCHDSGGRCAQAQLLWARLRAARRHLLP